MRFLDEIGEIFEYLTRIITDQESTFKSGAIKEVIRAGQAKAKARYDLRRAAPRVFKLGDAVGVRRDITRMMERAKSCCENTLVRTRLKRCWTGIDMLLGI